MAIETQDPSYRRERVLNEDLSLATPFRIMDRSNVQLANRSVVLAPAVANTRKRAREEATLPTAATESWRLSPIFSTSTMPQLQSNPVPSLYPASFMFAPDVQNQQCQTLNQTNLLGGQTLHEQTLNRSSPPLRSPHAMLGRINRHADMMHAKIDSLARLKEEIFRKVYIDKWQALFKDFKAEAERTIRTKDEALVQLTSRCLALEDELSRKNAESASWKALAASELSNGIRLRDLVERLVKVPIAPSESCGSSGGGRAAGDGIEDAESVQVGLEPALPRSCLVCRHRRATVLMLPCRCLSMCSDCQVCDGAMSCPSCGGVVKGCINVVIPWKGPVGHQQP